MKTLYERLGYALRDQRLKLWYSQADIAKKVGLTRTSVVNIEAGRQRIRVDQIEDFARALRLRPIQIARALWK